MGRTRLSGGVAAVLLLAACSSERMTDANGNKPARPSQSLSADRTASVCHLAQSRGEIIEVSAASLAAHKAHGDHVARLEVDPNSNVFDDGIHFRRITDAIATARKIRVDRGELEIAACRITISVVAGQFRGTFDPTSDASLEQFPLVLDVPQVTLHGALLLHLDPMDRPTGEIESGSDYTTLVPNRPLAVPDTVQAMIVVADNPNGAHGDGVIVEGFSFQSGHVGVDLLTGGTGVLSLRVKDLLVQGNRFDSTLIGAVDLRASSANVVGNYAKRLGAGCAICLAGPGKYTVSNNRILDGANVGVFVVAVTKHIPFSLGTHSPPLVAAFVLPSAATIMAAIEKNDIEDHTRQAKGVGAGIRIVAQGDSTATVKQTTQVQLSDNVLVKNSFGLMVDAGFPGSPTADSVGVTLRGNTLLNNCQHDLFVAFARHTRSLGIPGGPVFPYLKNFRYRLTLGGDTSWNDAWYDNPSGLGNTLVVDGDTKLPGSNPAFDATRCH